MPEQTPPISYRTIALATHLRAIFPQLRRRLHEHWNAGDVTPNQAATLLQLDKDGPATTSELSRAIGVRTQSMGAIVAALQGNGYVCKVPDPNDGRRMIISLTDTFHSSLAEGRASRSDWLSRTLTEQLSSEELQELERAVLLLQRLVDA